MRRSQQHRHPRRPLLPLTASLALGLTACNSCTLFGDARWEVGFFGLPRDVTTATVTTVDRYEGQRTCVVNFVPNGGGDTDGGYLLPEIDTMDCPDASWVYVYVDALYVNNDTPRKFAQADVALAFTAQEGPGGGFGPVTVRTDWSRDVLDSGTGGCTSGATADNYLDALTGERFSPP